MNKILPQIKSSDNLKELKIEEKKELCQELRTKIIDTVSTNGGHLASNLGVVELSVALLSVFDLPKDSIIWDVGHQCYCHKMLTGRYSSFSTIRQKGGLAGFPDISESDCDIFTTGHSSTSISSALGLAVANQIDNNDNYTVAVIGDGALSGGLAFEGLNNVSRGTKNFIVILNDNKMSISKNVGAVSKHLNSIRVSAKYIEAKDSVEKTLNKIPLLGRGLSSVIKGTKSIIKKILYTKTIFECMGFAYYGIYDGHNLQNLIEILRGAKKVNKPVLIHIKTTKGKGYNKAEYNPKDFHGVSSFDTTTGKSSLPKNSFSNVFGNCISNIASQNDKICAITAAMTEGTGLGLFASSYKSRFFDVGIAEAHAVTFSAGLAKKGLLPVFAVYSTFLQRAYDSIIHDIALQNLKVILAIDRAGFVGDDGKTHQGLFDVGFLKTVPNITVYSPSFFDELDFTLQKLVNGDYSLCAIRYPRGHEGDKPKMFSTSNNDFDVYGNENSNDCIVCYGRIFSNATKVADELKIKVIKLNRILPIPSEAVNIACKAKNVLFAEEAFSGIASDFIKLLYQNDFKGNFKINDVSNPFCPHSNMNEQISLFKLDEQGLFQTINQMRK